MAQHIFDELFDQLKIKVKEFLDHDGGGHDYQHAQRVFNLALHICQNEGGDELIIGSAALVHDICRPREKQTGKSHFGDEALGIIDGVLQSIPGYTSQQRVAILEVVKLHDIYDRDVPMEKTLELKIVQDADNLDAIGAIGIARVFAFGGAHGSLMYDPDEDLQFDLAFEDNPTKKRPTSIGHFYEKLLKLSKYMNTNTGKEMAQKRHEFMEKYLEQFFAECAGER